MFSSLPPRMESPAETPSIWVFPAVPASSSAPWKSSSRHHLIPRQKDLRRQDKFLRTRCRLWLSDTSWQGATTSAVHLATNCMIYRPGIQVTYVTTGRRAAKRAVVLVYSQMDLVWAEKEVIEYTQSSLVLRNGSRLLAPYSRYTMEEIRKQPANSLVILDDTCGVGLLSRAYTEWLFHLLSNEPTDKENHHDCEVVVCLSRDCHPLMADYCKASLSQLRLYPMVAIELDFEMRLLLCQMSTTPLPLGWGPKQSPPLHEPEAFRWADMSLALSPIVREMCNELQHASNLDDETMERIQQWVEAHRSEMDGILPWERLSWWKNLPGRLRAEEILSHEDYPSPPPSPGPSDALSNL